MSDLAERLRAEHHKWQSDFELIEGGLLKEAADKIEADSTEIGRLRAELALVMCRTDYDPESYE